MQHPGNDAGEGLETGTSSEAGGNGSGTCGASTPSALQVGQFGKMEQMSVAPDGTVYWSNQGPSIGRNMVGYTGIEKTWKTIAGSKIFGIALDPKRNILYAGSRENPDKLYKIPTTGSGSMTTITLSGSQGINGVTIADDGTVYFDDQTKGSIYRIGPTETTPTLVNTTPVSNANDLAFGPDGWLYVNCWTTPKANITRLKLQNGTAMSQETFVDLPTGDGDGIAFDSAGNLYAAAGSLYKVTPSKTVTPVASAASAGIEFGCGAISCTEMFYSASGGTSELTVPTGGLNVYWHRP